MVAREGGRWQMAWVVWANCDASWSSDGGIGYVIDSHELLESDVRRVGETIDAGSLMKINELLESKVNLL